MRTPSKKKRRKQARIPNYTHVDFERAGFVPMRIYFYRDDGTRDFGWTWVPDDARGDPDTLLPGASAWLAAHEAKFKTKRIEYLRNARPELRIGRRQIDMHRRGRQDYGLRDFHG